MTVTTLSRATHLSKFTPTFFDYIIIDEFHHAAADSYQKIIEYFTPKFLLGLTATPYRLDNKDIFSICDDNVIYEISLKQAIERDLLVPFNYHAIYDPTDYDQVSTVNGRYVIEDLESQLSYTERADLIFETYCKMGGKRTIGFCVSIKHADYMVKYFNDKGIPSTAIHSQSQINHKDYDRFSAVESLESGHLKIIFVVDIFNEGVDIPLIDTVMFLRPTESYVIFLQQLGRGLRKYNSKEYLTVIDFIGNYKRAHYIPLLLAGENPAKSERATYTHINQYEFPEGCTVNFDFRVIDLFEELAKRDPLVVRLKDTYWRIKNILGYRPTRKDIYQGSDIPIREFLKDGWLRFLDSLNELLPNEESWLDTPVEDFLKEIERTRFTKAYKIPTIKAFLNDENIVEKVKLESIAEQMMYFYRDHPLHQKDLNNKNTKNWTNWELKHWASLAKNNPVHFLCQGSFFNYDEINKVMYLDNELVDHLSPELARHITDILEYRRIDYFKKRFND